NPAEQLAYDRLEREWQAAGREALPAYFARFGVLSARQHLEDRQAKAREESRHANTRPPSAAEARGIDVLTKILAELAPTIMHPFESGKATYTVARTDVVLGELKHGRAYRSLNVFLAEQVFVADFAEALAV